MKTGRDGKPFTPTEQRLKEQLMRQFLQRDGTQGATPAFQDGWVQAFGKHVCLECNQRFEFEGEALEHLATAQHLGRIHAQLGEQMLPIYSVQRPLEVVIEREQEEPLSPEAQAELEQSDREEQQLVDEYDATVAP